MKTSTITQQPRHDAGRMFHRGEMAGDRRMVRDWKRFIAALSLGRAIRIIIVILLALDWLVLGPLILENSLKVPLAPLPWRRDTYFSSLRLHPLAFFVSQARPSGPRSRSYYEVNGQWLRSFDSRLPLTLPDSTPMASFGHPRIPTTHIGGVLPWTRSTRERLAVRYSIVPGSKGPEPTPDQHAALLRQYAIDEYGDASLAASLTTDGPLRTTLVPLGILHDLIFLSLCTIPLAALLRRRTHRRLRQYRNWRDRVPRCPSCNYDRTGLLDRQCPECGWPKNSPATPGNSSASMC